MAEILKFELTQLFTKEQLEEMCRIKQKAEESGKTPNADIATYLHKIQDEYEAKAAECLPTAPTDDDGRRFDVNYLAYLIEYGINYAERIKREARIRESN